MAANKINRNAVVIDNEDQVDFIRLRPKPLNRVSIFRQSLAYLQDSLSDGILGFITIKVILWDILISLADIISDFLQGYTLFRTPGKSTFGLISLCINWIPGVAASIHLMSMYRTTLPAYQVALYALLLLVCYPLIPFVAYVRLLFKKPKSSQESISADFITAQYHTIIVHALTGGLESPIQLIYQLWLVLNGIIVMDWNQIVSLTFQDAQGNQIFLPYTASLCIMFSVVSILKAILEFNVSRMHVPSMRSWGTFCTSLPVYLDFLPYLATSAFFRISAIIGIMTYLWHLGFISMTLMLIANLIINQICLRNGETMNYIPHWLILFMSLFVPVCFSTKDSQRKTAFKMIQKKTFFYQTCASLLIYGGSILVIMILVDKSAINYEEEVILDNTKFNGYGILVLIMGLFSFILSFRPKVSDFLCTENDPESPEKCSRLMLKSFWALLILGLIVTPLLLPNLIFGFLPGYNGPSWVVYNQISPNETKIVQVTTIIGFDGMIDGFLENQWLAKSGLPANFTKRKMTKNQGFDGDVIAISRLVWTERRDSILLTNPAAILVIDTERLMPSSPQPKFYDNNQNVTIPTFLVRKEDGHHFLPNSLEFEAKFLFPVKIYGNYQWIPDPEWICDVPNSDCIPLVFSAEGYLAGNQYRTKTCYYGGQSCKDSKNEQEKQGYCNNGNNIQVCPLDPYSGFGRYELITIDQTERTFRSNPPYLIQVPNLQFQIRNCDKGYASVRWTKYLTWQDEYGVNTYISKRYKRRFCFAQNNDGIFEERYEEECCKNQTICGEYLSPCKKVPLE